jgi:hypothetical protein
MTATRKDYEAVASAIHDALWYVPPDAPGRRAFRPFEAGVQAAAHAVADAFASTSGYTPNGNRRFDRERFLAACGL